MRPGRKGPRYQRIDALERRMTPCFNEAGAQRPQISRFCSFVFPRHSRASMRPGRKGPRYIAAKARLGKH